MQRGPLVDLLAALSVHKLDLVLADSPVSPAINIRAYNHSLGQSGITFFCREPEATRYRGRFPMSLDGAPMLMPTGSSSLRRSLEFGSTSRGSVPWWWRNSRTGPS